MTLACLQQTEAGVILSLYIQPRSSRNQIVGLHGDRLKLKICSPPVDGAANRCCRDYLAKLFKLPKGQVELLAGERSRQKRLLLQDVDLKTVTTVLETYL